MDRFEAFLRCNAPVEFLDLHSSMDRFEDFYVIRVKILKRDLHSSMDRFEVGLQLHCYV